MRNDDILLSSLEKIAGVMNQELHCLQNVNSVHLRQISAWADEIRAYIRVFEDISLPARLAVEHILDLKYNDGLLGVETEIVKQERTVVDSIQVHEFGVIHLSVGNMQMSWKDSDYNYYFYPDIVELRTADEKSLIKFFFSRNFPQQTQKQFEALKDFPQVVYVHPELTNIERELWG
jgi:hypothetical protein